MRIKDFYDDIAVDYQNLRYGCDYNKQVAKLELDFIQKYLKEGSCLEVGAGTGRATEFLLANVKEVLAVDISPRMLEQLRNSLPNSRGLTTKVHDINELDTIGGYGSYDCVICLRVLSHLEKPLGALKKLAGSIKRDGILIMDMWNVWGYNAVSKRLHLRPSAVYTRYMKIRDMREIIAIAGLSVIDRRGFGLPPLKFLLPIEKSSLSFLDFVAQRIIWVCYRQNQRRV